MNKQLQKYHLSLAGEFFVAAELQRQGLSAAVTYGNAKSADVVAFSASGEKSIVIEVKSTSQVKWVVGGKIPATSNKPWVFVHIPTDPIASPSYYVILQSELNEILTPIDIEYRQKFKEKRGIEYGDRAGVISFTRKQAELYKNAWSKISDQLALTHHSSGTR